MEVNMVKSFVIWLDLCVSHTWVVNIVENTDQQVHMFGAAACQLATDEGLIYALN